MTEIAFAKLPECIRKFKWPWSKTEEKTPSEPGPSVPEETNVTKEIEEIIQPPGPSEPVLVRADDGSWKEMSTEQLLSLLLVDNINTLEQKGNDKNNETKGLLKKLDLMREFEDGLLKACDNNGKCDWKKAGLEPLVASLKNEGITLPLKDKELSSIEKDQVIRSLSQRRDDLTYQAHQGAQAAQRCLEQQNTIRQFVFSMYTLLKDAIHKIIANISR